MRFTSVLVAGAAFVAGVIAQTKVEFTNSVFGTLMAGQPFTLTWNDAQGPVTITLRTGASNNLQTVTTVATGQTGTSFVWTPSTSIPSGSYALEITDGTTSNYSPMFVLGGGSASAAPTVSGSASASAASASLPPVSSASASGSTASSSASAASTMTTSASSSSASGSSTTKSSSGSSSASKTSGSSSSSSASSTSSSSASSTSSTAASTAPPDSAASGLASPLAFVLLAVAALITLN